MPRALFIYLKTPPGHSSIMLQLEGGLLGTERNWEKGRQSGSRANLFSHFRFNV